MLTKKMETGNIHIVYDALLEAKYIISNEIQCVIDEDVYKEYQLVINKIEYAVQIMKKHYIIQ